MKIEFTQGTIITYIRSEKYPDIRCYGVVVSARCDLAQDKIKSIYLLSALSIQDWIHEVWFCDLLKNKLKGVQEQLKGYAKTYKLDLNTLWTFGADKSESSFLKITTKADTAKIKRLHESWRRYDKYQMGEVTPSEKRDLIRENIKELKSELRRLHNGAHTKYCLIPEKAYQKGGSGTEGLIVDLYDIQQLSMAHREPIMMGRYDFQTLEDEAERERLNRHFYFASEEDYIIAAYQISSPWIEYLVQHFANAFSRIGVDNAGEDEITEFCDAYCQDGEELT